MSVEMSQTDVDHAVALFENGDKFVALGRDVVAELPAEDAQIFQLHMPFFFGPGTCYALEEISDRFWRPVEEVRASVLNTLHLINARWKETPEFAERMARVCGEREQ